MLVNAWDAASARIAERAGSKAVATTSAGVAWSLGAPDGDALGRDEAVALVRRVVGAVSVPVTADIESGFGKTPDDVAETVRAVVAAGATGVNIEDGDRDVDEQCARLAAARAAGGTDLFINARLDAYLRGRGDVAEVTSRAEAFIEAGADGIFVPGVTDPAVIRELVRIPAPLNVLIGSSAGPSVAELAALGVARVSLGSVVAQAAYATVRRATEEALTSGTYAAVADALDYGWMNDLMTRRSA